MLKHTALALFLLGLAFAQKEYQIEVHLDDDGLLPGPKVKCMGEVPAIVPRPAVGTSAFESALFSGRALETGPELHPRNAVKIGLLHLL